MKQSSRQHHITITACIFVALAALLFNGHAANKNAISYNKDGWQYLKKENYKKAIFSFKNALHQNPKYKEALIGLGDAYLEVEAFDQSYDLFTTALAIDKNNPSILVGIGKTLAAMGRYTEAIGFFNKALKLSEQNLDARYGIAALYAYRGNRIWAKRALQAILRIDPYHYDSLLLMADIKSGENRLKEARRYVEKAIDTNSESSKAYTVYGEILLREFLNTEDDDLLNEAKNALSNALAIQRSAYRANRAMGFIHLMEKKYGDAVSHFKTAVADHDSAALRYGLAVSYDRAGNQEAALEEFLKAYKQEPSDSLLRSRMEDFLIVRDYKIGHPARVMLNKENYELALSREKKNLPDQSVMYLRRSILLNPMNIDARARLMDYYNTQGYDRYYIDEMKEILRLTQDRVWQEKLSLAVMKRRDQLYHREGYSAEEPPRNVPVILVLDFDPTGRTTAHPDAGSVIAGHISFVLGQYGRMRPVSIRNRNAVACGLTCGGGHLDKTMEDVDARINAGDIEPVDYILYGEYNETGNQIAVECRLLDYKKGFAIGEFSISEAGQESLPQLALKAAKRVYDMVPYSGKILKIKDAGIITNIGLFDGIETGEKLVIYKIKNDSALGDKLKKKIVLTVRESDTLICYAEPQKPADIDSIDSNDIVLPLKKRRSKRIE